MSIDTSAKDETPTGPYDLILSSFENRGALVSYLNQLHGDGYTVLSTQFLGNSSTMGISGQPMLKYEILVKKP